MRYKGRVALVGGFWAQNIGNAFFNIGAKFILEQVFPHNDMAHLLSKSNYIRKNRMKIGKKTIKYLRKHNGQLYY